MLAIAFVLSGYTAVQINALLAVAVNGLLLQAYAVRFLKSGVQVATEMVPVAVIDVSI
jgi:hypothetical protein